MISCNIHSCPNEGAFFYLEMGDHPIAICKKCNDRYLSTIKLYNRYVVEPISQEEYLKIKRHLL